MNDMTLATPPGAPAPAPRRRRSPYRLALLLLAATLASGPAGGTEAGPLQGLTYETPPRETTTNQNQPSLMGSPAVNSQVAGFDVARSLLLATDLYDVPGGNGRKIGMLPQGFSGPYNFLLHRCQADNWCLIAWGQPHMAGNRQVGWIPISVGWIWSASGAHNPLGR